MLRVIFIAFLFFTLTACINQEDPAVTKEEETPEEQNSPKLVEEKGADDEEDTLFIEFSLMDEQISINASQVGILQSYLEASENKTEELEKMTLKRVAELDNKAVYLLEFACTDGACSYLLLAQGEQSASFLAEDLARFKLAKLSPDENYLFLIFSRKNMYEGVQFVQDKLVVMDLMEWQITTATSAVEPLPTNDYAWPILKAGWKSDNSIDLTVPDITIPEEKSLIQWNSSNRETKNIEVTVEEKPS